MDAVEASTLNVFLQMKHMWPLTSGSAVVLLNKIRNRNRIITSVIFYQ